MLRTHTCGELSEKDIGKTVILAGWVRRIREIGSLIFIDLRDRYGRTQIVIEDKELLKVARNVGIEYVIKVEGKVRERPPKDVNPDHPTGRIEVYAHKLEVLNESKQLPFLPEDDVKANEETRLKWRFLDLRRPKMQRNMYIRSKATFLTRKYFIERGFLEIETPMLTKSTPEGARDFIVPSRMNKGKFYALPQSPQLYKQTLMVSGFDRYFQIARCFRDEDLRADRQPEFTQIDVEMSFADMDDVMDITEGLIKTLFENILGIEVSIPFERLTYREAIERYGSDKPDLRSSIQLEDITDSVEGFRITDRIKEEGGRIIALPLPVELSRKDIEEIRKEATELGAEGLLFFKTFNGLSGQLSKYIKDTNKLKDKRTYLVVAGKGTKPYTILGELRNRLVRRFKLLEKEWSFLWIKDFPLLEWNKDEGRIEPAHHIFTSIYEEDLNKLDILEKNTNTEELQEILMNIRGKQYDLVINGNEIGSGSIRIHRRELQERVMRLIGLSDEEIEKRFGFFLKTLEYGAPPHGGIALGFDRIVALLAGEESIREVIAFPKTTSGQGLFEDTPSYVDDEQLRELGIEVSSDE